jgi:GNAT superfamily N-acetyltransferase
MQTYEVREGDLLVSTDRARLDFDVIHKFLSTCYWTPGISMEQVRRQIEHSTLVFGLYRDGTQIGFARVLSDLTRFGYLCDVFIVEPEQRKGLGQFMLRALFAHPELTGIRKWILATADAHGVYEKLGFELLPNPDRYMVWKPQDRKWM